MLVRTSLCHHPSFVEVLADTVCERAWGVVQSQGLLPPDRRLGFAFRLLVRVDVRVAGRRVAIAPVGGRGGSSNRLGSGFHTQTSFATLDA